MICRDSPRPPSTSRLRAPWRGAAKHATLILSLCPLNCKTAKNSAFVSNSIKDQALPCLALQILEQYSMVQCIKFVTALVVLVQLGVLNIIYHCMSIYMRVRPSKAYFLTSFSLDYLIIFPASFTGFILHTCYSKTRL